MMTAAVQWRKGLWASAPRLWYNSCMGQRIYQVDSFTDEAFSGNPAGVCPLDGPADEDWMQRVAAEINASETAFFYPSSDGPTKDGFDLRWFTPTVEVDLCGHATLASAHWLWESGQLPRSEAAKFHTKSGLLTVTYRDGWIDMDFPAAPASPVDVPLGLEDALGARAVEVSLNRNAYLVELSSEAAVWELRPDLAEIAKFPVRGVIVTARSDNPDFDFVSRMFGPQVGIPEDPATGSSHCALGPYWADRLGKQTFIAYQASRRGGVIGVQVKGERVIVSGHAVTTFSGELAG